MKKRILVLLSLILIGTLVIRDGGLSFLQGTKAYAVGDLNVVWQSDPMFNEANIAPGFSVTKNVDVQNSAPSNRFVAARGTLTNDTGNMKSVMNIEIKEGATILYSNTLAQFFIDSNGPEGIGLSELTPGGSTTYSYKVTFDESAGNQFQNKSIVFDLEVGIALNLPASCKNIVFSGSPILGTSGNDKINGTSKNEVIMTFEGNDKINAGGGSDCIITEGTGDDKITAGTGNDTVITAFGNDIIDTGTGEDYVDSGDGNDDISTGSENDKVYSRGGNDKVDLGSGNDYAELGNGNDKGIGGSGIDEIHGGDGDDTLEGGSDNDKLYGESNTDKATGDSGADTCVAETKKTCEI